MSVTTSLIDSVNKALTSGEKRNFTQSLELVINLRDVDVSKPEKRFTETIELPRGLGSRPRRIAVIATGALALESSKSPNVDKVIEKSELELLVGNKKAAKKLARQFDYFLVEAAIMSLAARALGSALGSLGKAPVPIPPNTDIDALAARYKKSVTVRLRKIPQVSCVIGTEEMSLNDLVENANAVVSRVVDKLEKRWANVKSIYVKKTMSDPVKVALSRAK